MLLTMALKLKKRRVAIIVCEWFFKRDGIDLTELGTPAAVHASVQVDERLSFELQAAVLGQPSVFQLNA
jgi:hypothetical protein